MRSALSLGMVFLLALSSFAHASDTADRISERLENKLNQAETKFQRDSLKKELHDMVIQMKAFDDFADGDLTIRFKSNTDTFWKLVVGGGITAGFYAGAAIAGTPSYASVAEFNRYGKALLGSAVVVAFALYKVVSTEDDVRIYRETIEKLEYITPEQAEVWVRETTEKAALYKSRLDEIEGKKK